VKLFNKVPTYTRRISSLSQYSRSTTRGICPLKTYSISFATAAIIQALRAFCEKHLLALQS
jgi:hypothetical protein